MSESYIKKSLYPVNRLDFERLAFSFRPLLWGEFTVEEIA